jgi:hypothetical protein
MKLEKEIKTTPQQKLNFMGADKQFGSLVQLINTSKPNKWARLKYEFIRLAYLAH